MTIKRELNRLHAGEIDWNQFMYRTRNDWARIAQKQRKRFRAIPAAIELVDLKQELMVHAFKAYAQWDPEGGQALHRWVIIRAVQRTMDWINKQRNSYRQLSNAPSRCALRYENIPTGDELHDNPFDGLASTDAVQEEFVEFVQRAEKMTASAKAIATTDIERSCFDCLMRSMYNVDEAARLFYADPKLRLAARIGSRSEAVRIITKAINTNAAIAA